MFAQSIDTTIPQTIIENYVEAPIDPVTWIISLIAITVAAFTGILTWRQGLEIRKIETREHEWEKQDRISAHIEVTPFVREYPIMREGMWTYEWVYYLRLRNTGRAPAKSVSYTVGVAKELSEAGSSTIEQVATSMGYRIMTIHTLHPGEFFDFYFEEPVTAGIMRTYEFAVGWYDGRSDSQRTKNTILNL
ncbi:MAG: hypothetical protein GXP35_00475 [Actinobacteria bacterium]|nr:hypothetical protein [Actinomycetota bacterium]